LEEGDSKLIYAKSINTEMHPDTEGCAFYDIGDEGLFYFDNWDEIELNSLCKSWTYRTSGYEKNALQKGLYDCKCDLSSCWDRLSRRFGVPECNGQMDMMLCRWVNSSKHGCIWKGARQTCVNPYSQINQILQKRPRK